MDIKVIHTYLKQPELLTTHDLPLLDYIINKYPYFQAVKSLRLKILKDNGSYLYNQRLKEVAAFTTDREVLFDFVTSPLFKKSFSNDEAILVENENELIPKSNIEIKEESVYKKVILGNTMDEESEIILEKETKEEITEATILADEFTLEDATKIIDPNLFEAVKIAETASLEKELAQQPLDFDKNEIHSFNEWLKLSTLKVVHRSPEIVQQQSINEKSENIAEIEKQTIPKKKKIASELIDKFIENSPKIAPLRKIENPINIAKLNNSVPKDLMTETLAQVYLAQNNYKKAIQAYKILSLKNPEKSGFFADQIRKIEKLQANK